MMLKRCKIIFYLFIEIVFFLVFNFYLVNVTYSANLSSSSDEVSSHKISTVANHTINFTTPTGVAAGATITLAFNAGFNIGSVDYSDIDLEDDGFNLTLASSPSGAVYGASFTGNTLTITSGTEVITAGSVITIEIGTNATYQTTGDQQITNPATVGDKLVQIGGTFGDSGSFSIPILDSNYVTIGANVDPQAIVVDRIPPVCSDMEVSDITRSTASVIWQTSEASKSYVDYGLTTNYELGTFSDTDNVFSHQIDMSGLEINTTYFIRIRSIDMSGNQTICQQTSFETLGQPLLYFRAVPEKRLPSSGNNSTILNIIIYEQDLDDIVVSSSVTTDDDGYDRTIFFDNYTELPKNYDFLIKGYSHLKKSFDSILLDQDLNLIDFSSAMTVFLLAGDVNGESGDNYINSLDFSALSNHIYTDDYRNDLNQDGIVNGLDFSIAVSNMWVSGDEH